MSIRLTLCGSNVCLGRNLITVFFTVNTPAKKFFAGAPACRLPDAPFRHPGKARAYMPGTCITATRKKKALLFSCISSTRCSAGETAKPAHACAPAACLVPNRALPPPENFFRPDHFRGIASGEMRKLFRPDERRDDGADGRRDVRADTPRASWRR